MIGSSKCHFCEDENRCFGVTVIDSVGVRESRWSRLASTWRSCLRRRRRTTSRRSCSASCALFSSSASCAAASQSASDESSRTDKTGADRRRRQQHGRTPWLAATSRTASVVANDRCCRRCKLMFI